MQNIYTMSRRSFLRAGAAGLGLMGATVLAGCTNGAGKVTGSGAAGSNASNGLKKVTFALDWTPNTNHTGLYVARERGYYKDAGLDVDIIQGPEDGADSAVASGEVQFGVSFQDTMAGYVSGDSVLPVTAVCSIIQHNTSGIISLKDKGITSPAKMAGHTYATWDMPIEKGVIQRCVENDGGDFSKVKLVPSTVTDEVSALKSDQVDCIWIYWAWAGEKCKLAGLDTNYFAFKDIDPVFDFYTPVIIANNDFLKDSPDQAKAFLRATKKGFEYAEQNADEAAQILVAAAPEVDPELAKTSQEFLADQYTADASSWGVIDGARWAKFYTWMNDNKLTPTALDANGGFSMDYLEA